MNKIEVLMSKDSYRVGMNRVCTLINNGELILAKECFFGMDLTCLLSYVEKRRIQKEVMQQYGVKEMDFAGEVSIAVIEDRSKPVTLDEPFVNPFSDKAKAKYMAAFSINKEGNE